MIECLSNPDWIKPQIDFLLFLQSFRVGNLEIFDKFFLSITVFGEFWLPTLICAIVYWCVDFRAGIYLFSLEILNSLITHFLKMVACVYRPWVLDNRIRPSELAVPFAKGYSFPSGHTSMSSSVLGGSALISKNKFLSLFLILLIILVGFSRLWLGVHTPQDVCGGLIIGITSIFGMKRMIDWAEFNSNRYLYLLAVIDILVLISIIFMVYFNTYRIDYVLGKLLVNPQKSIYGTIVIYSYLMGLLNGCFLCRRFFPFNPKEVPVKKRIIRGILGSGIIIFLLKYVLESFIMNQVQLRLALLPMFLAGLFVTLIYPIIFKKINL